MARRRRCSSSRETPPPLPLLADSLRYPQPARGGAPRLARVVAAMGTDAVGCRAHSHIAAEYRTIVPPPTSVAPVAPPACG
jgi:hypothetical protein